jgi:hypothetical protein
VADLGEFRGRRRADLLRGALFADEAWKALLQRHDALPQQVVFRIGDFRLVFLVIEPVMPLQLADEKVVLGLGLGLGKILHRLRFRSRNRSVSHYDTVPHKYRRLRPSSCPSPHGRRDP